MTQAPNLRWGTDDARVFTVEEGWGWTFMAVEHWNAERVGWQVCKQGTRFAALEPIFQGLGATAGSVAADAGRDLTLRIDHATQYLADHFQNQLKHWGISSSFALIDQPQTNGVADLSSGLKGSRATAVSQVPLPGHLDLKDSRYQFFMLYGWIEGP